MADIGLFFGSDEGNTELVAEKIQSCIGVDCVDLYDIADVTQLEFDQYNTIILGIPTWDFGQIQSDWEEFWSDLENINFTGKTVALFGLGDQFGYGDFFLDAMGDLYQVITQAGAKVVGFWSTEGYEFEASKAWLQEQGCFVGLAIDEDQQEELTDGRINQWCQQVCAEFGLDITITELTG